MRVLVVTVVHHPEDARILHRQIAALRKHGHHITYAAPFQATNAPRMAGIETLDLPRATGRSRRAAQQAARRLLATWGSQVDVVLLHDPELLLALPGLRRIWRQARHEPVVVWDVHEDTAAALSMKRYVPGIMRPPLRFAVHAAERLAERNLRLLLAEDAYQERFHRYHPVVPNLTVVPQGAPARPDEERVVYLGHLSRARGALDLIAMARELPASVTVDVIGGADPDVRAALTEADAAGVLRWHGFLPNDQALDLLNGALAGISLLHDQANYRHSRPTKIVEYMAHGIPVITTPNPLAVTMVEGERCGLVVPFEDPHAAAEAVLHLRTYPELRARMGARGHAAAVATMNWSPKADAFVEHLERWSAEGPHTATNGARATPSALYRTLKQSIRS